MYFLSIVQIPWWRIMNMIDKGLINMNKSIFIFITSLVITIFLSPNNVNSNTISNHIIQIAAGSSHTLALRQNKTVWSWGINGHGQLGLGKNDGPKKNPVLISGLNDIKRLAAGANFSIALREDGTVWAWGDGFTNKPEQISNFTNVRDIVSGRYHFYALKNDGTVWSWGDNSEGQLGDGTTIDNKNMPTMVLDLYNIVLIASGWYHGLAMKDDGSIWSWGYNKYGQLGDGTTIDKLNPTLIPDFNNVKALDGGWYHSVVLKEDGTVWTFGNNGNGTLGTGSTTIEVKPVKISSLNNVKNITVGMGHSFALKEDGSVWGWGWNNYGKLGDGTINDKHRPTEIFSFNNAQILVAAPHNSFAIKKDGTLWSCGYNVYGELGNGKDQNQHKPIQISGPNNVSTLTAGFAHSLFLKEDGTVWGCGYNFFGQTGIRSRLNKYKIEKIQSLNNVIDIVAGDYHSFALTKDGLIWAGGANSYGQLGTGKTSYYNNFIQVPNFNNVLKIMAGYNHSLALKEDGFVWSWGENKYGQLGNGSTIDNSLPAKLDSIDNVAMVASGKFHSLALKEDGTVWAWGINNYGQLGDGTTDNSSLPKQVSGLQNIIFLEAGDDHNLALHEDGTLWAWGKNYSGQLGNGTTNNQKVPVQVSKLTRIKKVAAGSIHSIALKNDGTLWAWGSTNYGQLGQISTPVQIPDLNNIKNMAAGANHNIALKKDGTIWAWGKREYGQLGDGYSTYLPKPCLSEINFKSKTFISPEYGTIYISILNSLNKTVTINYSTKDGTAISGVDYIATSGAFHFNEDDLEKQFPITILNNSRKEDKTVILSLSTPDDIFLNDGALSILTIPSNSSIKAPYTQTFSSIMPGCGWTYFRSTHSGRVQVTSEKLRMDNYDDGISNLNEAILSIDLLNAENVILKFFQQNFDFNSTSLPQTFTGHYNGDGVSVSNDGNIWYSIIDVEELITTDYIGSNYTIDLSSKIKTIQEEFDSSFNFSQNFKIKFQQHGYLPYPRNGREWDNIVIVKKQVPVEDSPVLSIHPEIYTVSAMSGTVNFTVTAKKNIDWSVSTTDNWLNIYNKTDNIFSVAYTMNMEALRNGKIQIISPDAYVTKKIVEIRQQKNEQPSISYIEDQTMKEDSSIEIPFIIKDKEELVDNLKLQFETSNQELLPVENILLNGNGEQKTIRISPRENAYGTCTVYITVTDSIDSNNYSFTIHIKPVNDQPIFTTNSIPILYEDCGIKMIKWVNHINPGADNESNQSFTFIIKPDKHKLLSVPPSISSDGVLCLSISPDQYGSAKFYVNLKDDGGTEFGGIDTSITQQFILTVEPVNDCPDFVKGNDQIVLNTQGKQVIPGWALNINKGPFEDNQSIFFNLSTTNDRLFSEKPYLSKDGTLSYSPNPDYSGIATVSVSAKDDGGDSFTGCDQSPVKQFSIRVNQASFKISLQAGWNLISLSFIPENSNVKEIFNNQVDVYEFKCGSYVKANTIKPGKGYWAKTLFDSEYIVKGRKFTSNTIKGRANHWYLIGGLTDKAICEVVPKNSIEVILKYSGYQYIQTQELFPEHGYWLKMKNNGIVNIKPINSGF